MKEINGIQLTVGCLIRTVLDTEGIVVSINEDIGNLVIDSNGEKLNVYIDEVEEILETDKVSEDIKDSKKNRLEELRNKFRDKDKDPESELKPESASDDVSTEVSNLVNNYELALKEIVNKDGTIKDSMTNLPQYALRSVAKAMSDSKYPKYNYSKPIVNTELIDSMLRHTNDYLRGIDIDQSGNHHVAHIAANALMLLDNIITGNILEGRNPVYLEHAKRLNNDK